MKLGQIIAILPGDSRASCVALGDPAPYRVALEAFNEAVADPGNAGKYASIELWTRTGVAKKRKLPKADKPARKQSTKKAAPSKKQAAPKPTD
jgi:hypothetical protein